MSLDERRTASRVTGRILAITPKGSLTVRSDGPAYPREGTIVGVPRRSFEGKVVRIFGPVARPYWSVRPRQGPSVDEAVALLGSTLEPIR
ncbi:MAG: H/ACA ribonucleoprotein complex subunit GAR1 [Thermoplasmata archaeon]